MSLLRAASSISGLTLVSRVLGLVRDGMTYHVLGVHWAGATFVLAWMVPNLLRRLFGEGALSAAFVPAFTKARQTRDDDAAKALLAGVSGALVIGLSVLIAIVIVASYSLPPEVWHLDADEFASRAERGALLWELLRITFPYVLPICVLAIYAGALNALGSFAPTAAAPIVLNLFWIGALVYSTQTTETPDPASVVRTVAWFVVAGGCAQLLLGVVPLARRRMLTIPKIPRHDDGTKAVFAAMAPAALGLSIVQINMLLDQALTEFLVAPGSNNHIYLANRLLLFPHAMVAIPLATVVFPALAKLTDSRAELRDALGRAIRYTLLLSVPACAGMAFVALPLIEVMFVHGEYLVSDAELTAATTIPLVLGLPAIGISQLYARALFAVGDTRAPARIAACLVGVNLALNLFFVLGCGFGVAGFTAATTCCAYLNALLLRRALRSQNIPMARQWGQLGRVLVATATMYGALIGIDWMIPDGDGRAYDIGFRLLLPIGSGIAAFFAAAALLRIRELEELRAWLRKRRHSTRTNSM